jgi:ubiquitin-like domain-containing CTD phosphatase 1
VLNPQQGLVIRPYRKAHLRRGTDRELLYLSAYLSKIARLDSLAQLDHRWGGTGQRQGRRRRVSPAGVPQR